MYKKIISIFLLISFVFAGVVVNAEETASDDSYNKRVEKLTYLGIYFEEGTEKDTEVTRANFIRDILKFANVEASSEEKIFFDVDKDHPCFSEISTGARLGYMVGYTDGNYYPENIITINDAVKAFVNVLGYEVIANQNGGYPNGYIYAANSIGLLDGIEMGTVNLDYEIFSKLIENALECNVLEIGYDGNTIQYTESDEIDALWKFHNIAKVKAVVTANAITGLKSINDKTQDTNYVKLNDESVLAGDTNISDYLGYAVEAYVYFEDEDETGEVRYFEEDKRNNVLNVDAKYVFDDSSDFSAYNFVYETEAGSVKNIKINQNTSIIYNGAAKPEYSKDDLIPGIGYLNFIDNNNDGIYDCINIFKAEHTIIVDYASSKDDGISIADKKDPGNTYLYDSEYDNYTVYVDGEKSGPTALSAGMLVLIGTNNEHSITYAYSETITGTISAVSAQSDDGYIVIDGVEYTLTSNMLKYTYKVNDSGTFWIDDKLNVYGFEKDRIDDIVYGYFIRGYCIEEEYPVQAGIRVLTTENEFETYELNETVRLNNRKKDNDEAMQVLKADSASENEWQDQLIMYKLDENGKVSELYTITEDGELKYNGKFFNYSLETFKSKYGGIYGDNVTEFSYVDEENNEYLANNGEYNYYGSSFQNLFWQDSDTIWFNIYDDLEMSYVGGNFTNEKHTNYEVEFYNILEDKNTADVIINRKEGVASEDTQQWSTSFQCTPTIVTEVNETLNEDDEVVLTITGNNQGKTVSLEYYDKMPEPTKVEFMSAKPGDIIYYETDTAGRITFLYKAFDIDRYDELGFSASTGLVHGNSGLGNTSRESLYVTVRKKLANNFFEYIAEGDRSGHIKKVDDGTTCYRMTVNGSRVRVENINWEDIQNGENIFIYSRYVQSKCIIAIDKN